MARLPELSKEDLEKIERLKGKSQDVKSISPEMWFIAEFGFFYGYEGIRAYFSGEISHKDAMDLLEATTMVWNKYAYLTSLGVFYGSKDGKAFNKGSKQFTNKIKVE